MAINILIIDENTPGHTVQAHSIANLIQNNNYENTNIECISFHYKLRGIFRPLIRFILKLFKNNTKLQQYILKICGTLKSKPKNIPHLIISSGGKSICASFILKCAYNAKNIYVGIPDPYPEQLFDFIVSPIDRNFTVPYIKTGIIPNTIDIKQIQYIGKDYWKDNLIKNDCWALMIGGNSKSHHYTLEDWNGLIQGIEQLSKIHNIKWLITTSRRTPIEIEELLDTKLNRCYTVELVLYNRNPKKVIKPFLYKAKKVFVTQDSLTMASEALCSGKPVVLIYPNKVSLKDGTYFKQMIMTFSNLTGVERTAMKKLALFEPLYTKDYSNEITKMLTELNRNIFSKIKSILFP